jgi:uncharacterized membrane protein
MKRILVCLLAMLFLSLSALAQQEYVNRVGLFAGYSHLNTSSIGLGQNGFNSSGGVNLTRWLEAGADFSVLKGDTNLGLSDTKLGPILAPILNAYGIPPSTLANVALPISATTYTYQIGGQINIRKWKAITPFVRPVLGAMHETVDVKLTNPALAPIFQAAGLKTHLGDTVPMYGVGGGIDLNFSRHVGMRFSVDYAHTNMFSDLLYSQNTVRFSVGPTFKIGELPRK